MAELPETIKRNKTVTTSAQIFHTARYYETHKNRLGAQVSARTSQKLETNISTSSYLTDSLIALSTVYDLHALSHAVTVTNSVTYSVNKFYCQ
jgi:hypothetical protein